jgi:ABC-2 type transport system permease protein
MIGMVALPYLLASRGAQERTIAILDGSTSGLGSRLDAALTRPRTQQDGNVIASKITTTLLRRDAPAMQSAVDSLTARVGAGLDGFIIVTDSTLEGGVAEYRGNNVSSLTDMQRLQSRLQETVVEARLDRAGVDNAVVRQAQRSVNLTTLKVDKGKTTRESGAESFALAYGMSLILYTALILYGFQVVGSVIEEKSTRVVEVLVSSLRPFELMAGKILGVGGVGLFQMGIWGVSASILFAHQSQVRGLLGGAGGTSEIHLNITAALVAVFLLYFLLGYFFYSSMLAAVGSMVGTEAEGRQAAQPVLMLIVASLILGISIVLNPAGKMPFWLSVIPVTSPIAMPVRYAATTVPTWQVWLSIAVLAASVVGVAWIAARIYRVGILMYGKRPSLSELLRWIRTA